MNGHSFARQFGLAIVALAIGFLALFQMFGRVNDGIPSVYLRDFAVLVGAVVLVFIIVLFRYRRGKKKGPRQDYADMTLFSIALLLSLLGITMIARLDRDSSRYDWAKYGITSIGERQFMWLFVGLVCGILLLVFIRDYMILYKMRWACMIIGLALLLSPLVPGLGREINGARIWIHIGPYSMQPAEFAKIFLAIFFAGYLADHKDQISVGHSQRKLFGHYLPRLSDVGPIITVFVLSVLVLAFQKDLGTGLMFFAMFVCMLYLATGQRGWVYAGIVLLTSMAIVSPLVFSHVRARFEVWLNPFDNEVYNKTGGSWQLVNGLFGMAHGGLTGTGLGQGRPGLTTYANSDFIYTSLGEELGLAGVLAILMLYLALITAGILVALRTRDSFGKLLAGGLMFTMAFQVFIVVGGVTRVIPLTGLTLPFMAAGGSSMTANMILIFLVMLISCAPTDRKPVDADDEKFHKDAARALRNAHREAAAAGQRGQETRGRRVAAAYAARPQPEYDDEPSITQTSMQAAVSMEDTADDGLGEDPALSDLGYDYDQYDVPSPHGGAGDENERRKG